MLDWDTYTGNDMLQTLPQEPTWAPQVKSNGSPSPRPKAALMSSAPCSGARGATMAE